MAKQKQKQERQKKVEEALEAVESKPKIQEKTVEDDLFGGAGMNSKQEEE